MIIVENIIINNREFVHTYSDKNMIIERDGIQYMEAYDPVGFNRIYTETDIEIKINEENIESEKEN